MTNEQTNMVVFKNEAGDYFLVPQATLERGRVPVERKAEVERLIAESDDVGGYAINDNLRAAATLWYLGGVSFSDGEYRDAGKFLIQGLEQVLKGPA